jgi:hypothetical protein
MPSRREKLHRPSPIRMRCWSATECVVGARQNALLERYRMRCWSAPWSATEARRNRGRISPNPGRAPRSRSKERSNVCPGRAPRSAPTSAPVALQGALQRLPRSRLQWRSSSSGTPTAAASHRRDRASPTPAATRNPPVTRLRAPA